MAPLPQLPVRGPRTAEGSSSSLPRNLVGAESGAEHVPLDDTGQKGLPRRRARGLQALPLWVSTPSSVLQGELRHVYSVKVSSSHHHHPPHLRHPHHHHHHPHLHHHLHHPHHSHGMGGPVFRLVPQQGWASRMKRRQSHWNGGHPVVIQKIYVLPGG